MGYFLYISFTHAYSTHFGNTEPPTQSGDLETYIPQRSSEGTSLGTTLALDLGTATGYALAVGTATVSGTFNFKSARFEGGGMRYLRFRQKLDEMHRASAIDHVVFEEVRRHVSTDSAHVYGGLLAVLTAWCEEHGIPYESVPIGTWKKWATGKGNAGKEAVIATVKSWGFDPADDNEADALAVLHFIRAQTPAPKPETPPDGPNLVLEDLLK